jgi:hypothetical protein
MNTLLYVFTHLVPWETYVSPLQNLCTFYDVVPRYFDYHCSKERFFLIPHLPDSQRRWNLPLSSV